jgi:hypothetical protein
MNYHSHFHARIRMTEAAHGCEMYRGRAPKSQRMGLTTPE